MPQEEDEEDDELDQETDCVDQIWLEGSIWLLLFPLHRSRNESRDLVHSIILWAYQGSLH